jgi:hypothetical protein
LLNNLGGIVLGALFRLRGNDERLNEVIPLLDSPHFHPSVFLIPRFLYNRGLPRIFRRNPHA